MRLLSIPFAVLLSFATQPLLASADPDLAKIRSQGFCPGVARADVEVDFLLFFSTEAAAQAAGDEVDAHRYAHDVRTAAHGSGWRLRMMLRELPEPNEAAQVVVEVRVLAARHGSRYEGYGCGRTPIAKR